MTPASPPMRAEPQEQPPHTATVLVIYFLYNGGQKKEDLIGRVTCVFFSFLVKMNSLRIPETMRFRPEGKPTLRGVIFNELLLAKIKINAKNEQMSGSDVRGNQSQIGREPGPKFKFKREPAGGSRI